MVLKRIDQRLAAAEARARAVTARLRSPEALRLRARLRRWETALMGALLALGILLMMIHWSGSHAARPTPAVGAPPVSARADAGPDAGRDTARGTLPPPGAPPAPRADSSAVAPRGGPPASPHPAPLPRVDRSGSAALRPQPR